MLLIRNLEGENVNTVLEHFKDNGTPKVLNKLYHPKQAHKNVNAKFGRNKESKLDKLIEQLLNKNQGE